MLNNLLQMHFNVLQDKKLKTRTKAETTADLIGKKVADKITKLSRNSPQNGSETVENKTKSTGCDRKIPKERYIKICLSKKMIKIIDDLRLI